MSHIVIDVYILGNLVLSLVIGVLCYVVRNLVTT